MNRLFNLAYGLPIRLKLLVVIMLCSLVPSLGALNSINVAREHFVATSNALMEQQATEVGEDIDRTLFERYGDVQAFAASNVARSAVQDPAAQHEDVVSMMNRNMQIYDVYRLMLLVDSTGIIRAVNSADFQGHPIGTEVLNGASVAGMPWFRAAMAGQTLTKEDGGAVVAGPQTFPLLAQVLGKDDRMLIFASPVRAPTGAIKGVWVNFFDFRIIESTLGDGYRKLKNQNHAAARLQLLDSAGRVLVDWHAPSLKDAEKAQERRPADVRQLDIKSAGVVRDVVVGRRSGAATESTGEREGEAIGYAALGGAYDFPGLGWSTIVRLPVSDVYGQMNALRSRMLIASAAFGIVMLAISFAVSLTIAYPIRRLSDIMQRLVREKINIPIPFLNVRGEVGLLANATEAFKSSMFEAERVQAEQQMLQMDALEEERHVRDAVASDFQASVSTIVAALANTADEMERTATMLARNAEHTFESSSEAAESARQAEENTQLIASAAEELSRCADEIQSEVSQSLMQSGVAVDDTAAVDEEMRALSGATSDIETVVSAIQNIAEQTNLLALNATIESARAGPLGKGFAIVASEVKTLAGQTAQLTQSIEGRISRLQGGSQTAMSAVAQVKTHIQTIAETTALINNAAGQQQIASQDIAKHIHDIARAAASIHHQVSSTRSEAQQTRTAAESLLLATHSLGTSTRELETQVDAFLQRVRTA